MREGGGAMKMKRLRELTSCAYIYIGSSVRSARGGQAWTAYQIRGVFWSCSQREVEEEEKEVASSLALSLCGGPWDTKGVVLIGLRGDTH